MRLISCLILFAVLLISSFSGFRVEAHAAHEIEDQAHSQDITYHSHDHVDERSSSQEDPAGTKCPHFHIHGSTVVLAPSLTNYFQDISLHSFSKNIVFEVKTLHPQDYSMSLYRPPIA